LGAPEERAAPMATQDFEFQFGNGRYLRGRGWRGIIALLILLSAAVLLAYLSTRFPQLISTLNALASAR
jgi:hypothetical protein